MVKSTEINFDIVVWNRVIEVKNVNNSDTICGQSYENDIRHLFQWLFSSVALC